MKKLILAMAVGIGALALTACQSTSNSPAPAAASTVCTSGYQVVNGQTIPCTAGGYGYMPGNNGMPSPYTGTQGTAGGCSYWTMVYSMYGAYYVPMIDAMSGQLECVNIGQTNYSYLSSYGYTGANPLYGYCPYGNSAACGGSYYYGAGYYGQGYGNYGSPGICLGLGGSDDYGSSMFGGICF